MRLHDVFGLRAAINLLAAILFSTGIGRAAESPINTLTESERKDGWTLLFNGKDLSGWRSFGKATPPARGWVVENGVLKCIAGGKGGDILTDRTFDDFELSWEWSMPAKANNGVKYFILEERGQPIGHEYQMVDNSTAPDPRHKTASFYEVLAARNARPKPFGEWNHSRIVVKGNHVEHWLNGDKVLDYELGGPEVLQGVANSKFKSVAKFGTKVRGHVLLTYHQDEASYRNIKLREPGK